MKKKGIPLFIMIAAVVIWWFWTEFQNGSDDDLYGEEGDYEALQDLLSTDRSQLKTLDEVLSELEEI